MNNPRWIAWFRAAAPLFLSCQLAALGLMRHATSYSLHAESIEGFPWWCLWIARVASVVVFVAVAIDLAHARRALESRSFLIFAVIAMMVGLAVTFYASDVLASYAFAQTLVGVSHAWILMCWARSYASLDRRHRNRDVAISAVLAVFAWTFMGVLPHEATAPAYMVLVLGSALPLLSFSPHSPFENAKTGDSEPKTHAFAIGGSDKMPSVPWELALLMASYAVLYRLLGALDFSTASSAMGVALGFMVRLCGMVLLLVYLKAKDFEPNLKQMMTPLLFLTVVGLCALPVSDGFAHQLSIAVAESSWTFFYTLIWLVLFEYGRLRGAGEFSTFAAGWTVMNVFLLLAAPIAAFFTMQVNQGMLSLAALMLVVVYTLAVALMMFRRARFDMRPDVGANVDEDPGGSDDDRWATMLDALAVECSLTKKEREVFSMLARGWTLPAIEQEMVLSHSTVKGHARHIYRKLGVGGKQELIELVEERMSKSS